MGVMYWWSACLQDGISYNMLCFTERHVLLEVMFYLRVGIIGGHVLLLRCLTVVHVLQEGIPYRMICCTGGHILYEDRFNWRVCPIGSHVLQH